MNTAVLTRAGIAAAGAALLVGGLTACGTGKADGKGDAKTAGAAKAETPAEAVKASYAKTVAAKFATYGMTITSGSGKAEQLSGTKGWYPSTTAIDDKGDGANQVMIGDVVYTHSDKPLEGKSWMKMNLNKDGKPRSRFNDDPADYLAVLLGQQKVTLVGTEQIDGGEARHFKAALTNADLLAADESTKVMEAANRQYLHEALKEYTSLDVDLWIGKDGYPVRVDSAQGTKDGTTKVSAKFSGYGTTAPVSAPPADQVADFDDVMKGIDDKLKGVDDTLKEADKTLKDAGLGGLGGS
ncbi:hypothetical protein CP980_13985 [Streptomyces vinaceus]|uniref:Lipoprotein n=1 Tax=Streptomyces vinaceus TaxID=1960 RepID=A0A5J6J694_STRVI|nr:hypothetical protein [Streptomyces vinaceus]QEV46065.1 hypothetical protein CP980_13985 [Streptomyces vinaceus]GHE47845.1 hypothetical protein GCM10017778_34630 [Streptomyces vinaceus]